MRFLIADTLPLYREALAARLLEKYPHSSIHQAGNVDGLIRSLDSNIHYDLVLLDTLLDASHTPSLLSDLLQRMSNLHLLLILPSRHDSTSLDLTHLLGCASLARNEDASHLYNAVTTALATPLRTLTSTTGYQRPEIVDPRQQLIDSFPPQRLAVLKQVLRGHSNKQIAEYLNIVEATVKSHVSSIMKQLNVRNRTQILVVLQDYEFV